MQANLNSELYIYKGDDMKSSNHRGDGCKKSDHAPFFYAFSNQGASFDQVMTMEESKGLRGKIRNLLAGATVVLLSILVLQTPAVSQGKPISFSLQNLQGGTLTSGSLA